MTGIILSTPRYLLSLFSPMERDIINGLNSSRLKWAPLYTGYNMVLGDLYPRPSCTSLHSSFPLHKTKKVGSVSYFFPSPFSDFCVFSSQRSPTENFYVYRGCRGNQLLILFSLLYVCSLLQYVLVKRQQKHLDDHVRVIG